MFSLSVFKQAKIISAAVMGVVLGCVGVTANAATKTTTNNVLQGQVTGTQIANARYVTLDAKGKVSISGFTAKDGSFFYRNGETVSFYVGDVLLGSTAAKSSVPALALVEKAKNSDALSNLLRFLQTIDSDVNAFNGIQISNTTHKAAKNLKVDFDRAMSSFAVQAALAKLLAMTTNSPTLPDAVDALTNFRMSLLNAYNSNPGKTVLNLMNTKWKSTLTSQDCANASTTVTHTFNVLGHMTAGYHNLTPKKNGTCGGSSMAVLMSLYENDALFSCANGCSIEDLNSTVTLNYPTTHQAALVHQPNTNIITIIHQYADGREVIETLVKQSK